ncbi:MAG: lipoprotein, partial [Bacteroidales bacterium]|nr:lipoprotein [Bacteroidales bacterium]
MKKITLLFAVLAFVFAGCNQGQNQQKTDKVSIAYEEYVLPNGLKVIL